MTAFENTPIRGGGTSNPTSAQRSQTAAASPTSTKFKQLRVAENFYRRALEAEGLTPEQQRKREAENNSNRPKRTGPPRLLMCYLCGQQFGTSSLAIHQPQCYYKKLLQWEKNPPEARGPKPIHPDEHAAVEKQKEETIEEYNDRQFQQYTEMMVECDLCHRRFLPDRFVVHKRSCRVGGTISKPVLRSRSTPHTGTAPDTGRSTLEHEKKSVTFKGNTVEDGEEEEQEDATDEKASKSMVAGSIDRDTEDEEHGTRLQRTIDDKTRSAEISASLEPCPLCGRKYLTSKLEAHVAICKGKTLSSSVVSPSTSNLVPCCYCERKFDPSRVAKHESVCLGRKNVRVGAVSNKSSPAPTATKTLATPSRAHVSGASPGTSKSENQKFCTQCGMKYQPSASTKFCSECGMRLDSSNV